MTEASVVTEQDFRAEFVQVDAAIGGTELTMQLSFTASELGTWDAVGVARVVRGSTNPPLELECPMEGALTFNPESEVLPKEYTLQVRSHFPDGRVGVGLSVTMTALSYDPPSAEKSLTFTGGYTWTKGEPVTVSDATFEMAGLRVNG
ncbi:MAG TPA: hypothetical protein VMB79_10450 [Jatrophihabitans sp.]|nr:hypothetical protein [Jatrophihabitans sp.]